MAMAISVIAMADPLEVPFAVCGPSGGITSENPTEMLIRAEISGTEGGTADGAGADRIGFGWYRSPELVCGRLQFGSSASELDGISLLLDSHLELLLTPATRRPRPVASGSPGAAQVCRRAREPSGD